MSTVYIISNPSSGSGEGEKVANYIKEKLNDIEIDAVINITKDENDIIKFAKEASENNADKVFIVGGDGTLSVYMNAIKNFNNKKPVGIIPTGTMNNVARSLEISLNPYEAADQIIEGKLYKADMGLINDQIFTSTISAGPVPESAWKVSDEEKEQFGSLSYLIGGLKSMNTDDVYEYVLDIDGKTINMTLDLLVIGVSNTIIGYNDFFPKASYHDQKLHLFGLEDATILEKVLELSKLLTNENTDENEINENPSFITSFKELKIDMKDNNTHVTVDGNKGPSFPVHIKVLPEFVTFIVPQAFEPKQ